MYRSAAINNIVRIKLQRVREDEVILWTNDNNGVSWLDVREGSESVRFIIDGIYSIYCGIHQVAPDGSKAVVIHNNVSTQPLCVSQVIHDTSLTLQAIYPMNANDVINIKVFTTDLTNRNDIKAELVIVKLV